MGDALVPTPRFTPEQLDRFAHELAPLGPRTLDVLLDVTNQCNLKCRMCYFSFPEVFERPREQMSPAVFARVAQQTFPYARMAVLSAGCEPLVHDDFPGLLALAAPYAVPQLKYLTNGQLLGEDVARASIRCGVTEIHVSVDGATRETYEWVRRGASFDRLLENLGLLRDLKQRLGSATPVVQFNVMLMRRNVHELPELARLANRLGVEQLVCRHLLPYDGLDIEDECLVLDRAGANAALDAGLAAAASAGLRVVMFPERFDDAAREAAPWSRLEGAAAVARQVGFEVRHATAFAGPGLVRGGARPASTARPTAALRSLPPTPARASSPAPAKRTAGFGWLTRSLPWCPGPPADRGAPVPPHPFGHVDAPDDVLLRRGYDLVLEGWALHHAGVARVLLCERRRQPDADDGTRGPSPGDASVSPEPIRTRQLVPLAEARWIVGGRPDVAARFADLPDATRAAWRVRVDVHALPPGVEHELFVVAEGRDGRHAAIGRRWLVVDPSVPDPGLLYCAKPFRSVYVDAGSNLYPYPDCQTVEPFGRLVDATPFEDLWHGEAFHNLRRRILAVDPPAMCRGCPDFVNRNPDDPDYYVPRQLEEGFHLPLGVVDGPPIGVPLPDAGATVHGWAAGFSPVVRVELARAPLPSDDREALRDDGLVWWADAWLGDPREDVATANRRLPGAAHSGWAVGLLGTGLPPDTTHLELHVLAHNAEGARVELAQLAVERTSDGRWAVLPAQ